MEEVELKWRTIRESSWKFWAGLGLSILGFLLLKALRHADNNVEPQIFLGPFAVFFLSAVIAKGLDETLVFLPADSSLFIRTKILGLETDFQPLLHLSEIDGVFLDFRFVQSEGHTEEQSLRNSHMMVRTVLQKKDGTEQPLSAFCSELKKEKERCLKFSELTRIPFLTEKSQQDLSQEILSEKQIRSELKRVITHRNWFQKIFPSKSIPHLMAYFLAIALAFTPLLLVISVAFRSK